MLAIVAWLVVPIAPGLADGSDPLLDDKGHNDSLRTAVARYAEIAKAGGWPTIPAGETLKPAASDRRVPALRARLAATGDLAAWADRHGDTYDPGLVDSLQRFQRRHGLVPDGLVGPKTTAALNISADARVAQLMSSLEQLRTRPAAHPGKSILVNLPEFRLRALEGGEVLFDTRVVVGAPIHPTPVFSDTITAVVINPTWTVPQGIARKELLPKIKADPGFLEASDFAVLAAGVDGPYEIDASSIDWTTVDARTFTYRLRQRPGPNNALGRLKFLLSNPYDIYLHDTPDRSLFAKAQRSFSHGCIRVENPEQLAGWLLETPPGSFQSPIQTNMSGVRSLPQPVPIDLIYLTAWASAEGTVHFRKDIYGLEDGPTAD